MNDLITEARELCEKATPGPWFNFGDWMIHTEPDVEQSGIAPEKVVGTVKAENAVFIARSRTLIPELCDALEKANAQIESIHKSLDFAETQRQKSKNYTELAINNGLALGRIAVTIQHDFGPLPAPPAEGAEHERD